MQPLHFLIGLLIALVWGFNFVMLHVGLEQVSPSMLCLVRFFVASIPAIFFFKKPDVPFRLILIYGLLSFGLQFVCLFGALGLGMPTGLASIVTQTQVFFTIFIAYFLLDETPHWGQLLGALVAFGGIGLIGFHISNGVPLMGIMLILGGGLSWGCGNVVAKKMGKVNMLSLVVWSSFVAWPPLFLLSLYTDGWSSILYTFTHLSVASIGSITYIVVLSTWFAFAAWNHLLAKYPAIVVAPFTLLVPVVGMLSATLFLGESLETWKICAGLLVISGLCINLLVPRLRLKLSTKRAVVVDEAA